MPEQNDAYAEQRCAGQPQPRTVACNAGCQHAYASTCGEGRESGENFHGLICVVGLAHPVAARWLEPAVCERAVSLLAVGPVPAGWRTSDGAANDGEDGAGRRNLLLPAGDALVGMALFALVRAAEGHVERRWVARADAGCERARDNEKSPSYLRNWGLRFNVAEQAGFEPAVGY